MRRPTGVAHYVFLLILFLAAPAVFAASVVSEIRFVGMSNVVPRDLDSILNIAPGDPWREENLASIEKGVINYYTRRGFPKAQVTAQSTVISRGEPQNILVVIRVDEGPECRIRTFRIDEPGGFKSRKSMQRFNSAMYSAAKVKEGERYDEYLLNDRMRELREWLINENFILANTDNLQLTFSEDRTQVDVIAKVDFGDRASFGYEGNTLFTRGELSEFVRQLRATGLGRDYVSAIKKKILDEYAAQAYSRATIEVSTSEMESLKHITFSIHEGPRTLLERIKWEGLTSQNLANAQNIVKKNGTRLIERGFFVEKDVDKLTQIVLEDLQANGYLSSKIISKSVTTGTKPDSVIYSVQYGEGEQTFVNAVELGGFQHFSREKILETLTIREEHPLNPFALEEGIQKIRRMYRDEGFLEFKVLSTDDDVLRFFQKNRLVDFNLRVSEGIRTRVGEVRFEGLEKTREFIVRRELTVGTGDFWLGHKVFETEKNLKRLGLFSDVSIKAVPSRLGEEFKDMVISFKEAEPGTFEAGPGFRSDLGIRAFAQISYANMFGRHWIGSLSAEGNRRINDQYRFLEYRLDATFIEPRFLGTKNLFTTSVSTRKTRFPPNFNATATTWNSGFERRVQTKISPITMKLFYKLERIRQFDVVVNGIASAEDNQSMLIGSLVPSLIFDTRDSPLVTSKGQVTALTLEYANPYFSGQDPFETKAAGYEKWSGSTKWYFSLDKIVWSNVLAGGFLRSNIPDRPVPLIKLFRLGGYSTIRGFNEDSINIDNYSVKGTLSYINLRTQFDLPFIGELRFAPFLDAGNLFINNRYRGMPFMRAGAGAGLHYMTPVGPVNLDWGYKLNRTGNESPYQVHFSVGLI